MKHKKFVKQLMSQGLERNAANHIADIFRRCGFTYSSALDLLHGIDFSAGGEQV